MKLKKIKKLVWIITFLFCGTSIYAQRTITGIVSDTQNLPLPYTNIKVKGTTTGSATDFDGTYSIEASSTDILVFSYVGYVTQEIEVGDRTSIDVILENDSNQLNEVIVSSSRKPIRKLQATTAVNSIGPTEIATIKPETFTEAIQNTPGVTINESQGRKGGFRIRGFPGGNVYTTTLIDGLPASASAGLSTGTQEFYSFDPSVERIEVVRGAAATLFGRAAGAGAINIISRTGGEDHGGNITFTKYNNVSNEGHKFDGEVDYRADWNFNGPVSDKLRYNIGGFVINDSGTKEQHHKDTGGQLRANFDYLMSEKSKIRVSLAYLNTSFNNNTDTPWDFNKNAPGAGFLNSSSFTPDYNSLYGDLALPELDEDGSTVFRNPADFREKTWGGYIGVDATFGLGSNWSVNQKLRYQSFNWNDMNDITFSDFYDEDTNFLFRFLGRAEQDNSSLISETRLSKQITGANSVHNISAGLYYSSGERDRLGTNLFYFSNVNPRPTVSIFGTGLRNSVTTAHREEKSTGVFIGDEMVFFDKLSINAAFRYDWFDAFFGNDPEEIRSTGTNVGPETAVGLIEIDEKFEDYSFSVGVNYLLGESSAVYANLLRAFSLPSVATRTFEKPDGNEIINNLELGARAGLGDLTIDGTLFYTTIKNRVAFSLNDVSMEFEPRAGGENKILGGEIAFTYAPKFLKGLVARANVTLQNSEYVDFKVPLSVNNTTGETNVDQNGELFGVNIVGSGTNAVIDLAGNQVEGTPKTILSTSIAYNRDRWGIDFGGFTYSGIIADATNLYETPNLSVYNLGGYVTFPLGEDELRLSMRIKNLFDGNTPQALFATTRGDSQLREKQLNPTVPEGRQAFAVLQNPKRVLFTVGYKF